MEGGKLHMTPAGLKGDLAHYHYDSFTTVLEHIPMKSSEMITFNTGPDGKVPGVTFSVFGTAIDAKKKQ